MKIWAEKASLLKVWQNFQPLSLSAVGAGYIE
jgi:hypothetical protein